MRSTLLTTLLLSLPALSQPNLHQIDSFITSRHNTNHFNGKVLIAEKGKASTADHSVSRMNRQKEC